MTRALWSVLLTLTLRSVIAIGNPTPEAQLFAAIQRGDRRAARNALGVGATLSARDEGGRTPIAAAALRLPENWREEWGAQPPESVALLADLLKVAAARAHHLNGDGWPFARCGTIGRSHICWLMGEDGLMAFGRSGGLLLTVKGRYPSEVDLQDVDHDGRAELTLEITTGSGTGFQRIEHRIYFFDGQRFADPLAVVSSSYTDSTWFGELQNGTERFRIPPLSIEGEIRFRDTNHDGIADEAEAIERRWWGDASNKPAGRPELDTGPRWASERLRARTGFGLGEVSERVVERWHRAQDAPLFKRGTQRGDGGP